jgi:hypothetical protein
VHVPDEVIIEAFALSRERGAALLARLGDFNVWHGDLGAMRRDSPRSDQADMHSKRSPAVPLGQTLVMARAIELLQPDCRAVLANVYGDDESARPALRSDMARTSERSAEALTCKSRLLEIYASLQGRSGEQATPDWATGAVS